MVYRRIIQLSPTTKVVSLPSNWLKNNKIKKGDEVCVEEKQNALVISATSISQLTLNTDIRGLDEDLIWTAIDAFYILGYSRVELLVDVQTKKLLRTVVMSFPNFVIESETNSLVILTTVAKSLDIDFDKVVQRIRNLTLTMIDDAVDAMNKKSWDKVRAVKEIDYLLNTEVSMCFRYLGMSLQSPTRIVVLAQWVKLLEIFADKICILFFDIADQKICTDSDLKLLVRMRAHFTASFALFGAFTVQTINDHDRLRRQIECDVKKSVYARSMQDCLQCLYDLQEVMFQLQEWK